MRTAVRVIDTERADAFGEARGPDPTGGLRRTHAEVGHQVARPNRIVDAVGAGPVTEDDVVELRRALYGLDGVLRLHNAQEEESASSLISHAAH